MTKKAGRLIITIQYKIDNYNNTIFNYNINQFKVINKLWKTKTTNIWKTTVLNLK